MWLMSFWIVMLFGLVDDVIFEELVFHLEESSKALVFTLQNKNLVFSEDGDNNIFQDIDNYLQGYIA